MKLVILVFLFASAFADISNLKNHCGPFEVYREPKWGTLCDSTCNYLHAKCRPTHCSGCMCLKGYVRDENGRCIRKDECPPKCLDPNEVWYPKCNAPQCEQECKNWGQSCEGTPHEGCFCGKGYARDNSGKCIQMALCLFTCPGKEEFYDSLGPSVGLCTQRCTEDGEMVCDDVFQSPDFCNCRQGYLRSVTGECIPGRECKPECSEP